MARIAQAAAFVSTLFGESDFYLALWRGDTKTTTWVSATDAAKISKFETQASEQGFNAYFGCCLQSQALGPGSRGSAATARVMPGLWVDLDFAEKPHDGAEPRKKVYPPRAIIEKALDLIPIKTSLRIATGGGIHAYWLFDKPLLMMSPTAQAQAAELVKSWQGLIKSNLLKLGGYSADSTHDLARVMRLPGTPHTRHPGVTVDYVEGWGLENCPRYTIEQLDGYLGGGRLPIALDAKPAALTGNSQEEQLPKNKKTSGKPNISGGADRAAPAKPAAARPAIEATADSDPPSFKLSNLMEASVEFKSLWLRKISKPSPSEYDMSLANHAVNAGWSDQETAALLVAFSRQHFPDHLPKLLRVTGGKQDYLCLTITKAHDKRRIEDKSRASENSIEALAMEVRDAEQEGREVKRSIVLDQVSEFLGIKVLGFRQTGRRDEVYSLLVSNGGHKQEVIIGSAASIHSSPVKLCERIMADCGRYVPISKKLKTEWGSIVAGLIAIREFHEVLESDLSARTRAIVEEYLHRHRGAHNGDDDSIRINKARQSKPFFWKGRLYVVASELKQIASERDKSLASGDLYIGLRQLGFTQETIGVTGDGSKTSRSYWAGIFELVDDEPGE